MGVDAWTWEGVKPVVFLYLLLFLFSSSIWGLDWLWKRFRRGKASSRPFPPPPPPPEPPRARLGATLRNRKTGAELSVSPQYRSALERLLEGQEEIELELDRLASLTAVGVPPAPQGAELAPAKPAEAPPARSLPEQLIATRSQYEWKRACPPPEGSRR